MQHTHTHTNPHKHTHTYTHIHTHKHTHSAHTGSADLQEAASRLTILLVRNSDSAKAGFVSCGGVQVGFSLESGESLVERVVRV